MIWPGKPKVDFAIETILLPAGKRKLTSRIKNAPTVMTSQHAIKKKIELNIPAGEVDTGSASMPPPIDVPTISKIPPMSFEFDTLFHSALKWSNILRYSRCIDPLDFDSTVEGATMY